MAVYSRGKQEKNRRKKGTTEKTKVKVCVIDVTICKGSWYQTRLAMVDAFGNTTELT
jgi:hypothetical protein